MDIASISVGDNPPHEINVIIEILQRRADPSEAADLIRAGIDRAKRAA
jgi:hypothetical protein